MFPIFVTNYVLLYDFILNLLYVSILHNLNKVNLICVEYMQQV
jgi:hypothetical protein